MNDLSRFTGSRARFSRGLALLEALIAFIVMAVGLLALLSFQSATQKSTAEAKAQAEAVSLAEAKLQELESFVSASADPRLNDGAEGSESIQGQTTTFTRAWSIDDPVSGCTPEPVVDMISCQRIATVTVTWRDRNTSSANTAGVLQSVVVTSDIDYDKPTEGIEQFARQLVTVMSLDGIGEVKPGAGDAGGKKEILSIPRDEYTGTIPEGYTDEYVYVYRIYVSGDVAEIASTDETGEIIIEAPELTVVVGASNLSFVPVCSSTGALEQPADGSDPDLTQTAADEDPTSRDYWCRMYYVSTNAGVQPTITFGTSSTAVLCTPNANYPPYPANEPLSDQYDSLVASVLTGTLLHVVNFNPLTASALAHVVLAPRASRCP